LINEAMLPDPETVAGYLAEAAVVVDVRSPAEFERGAVAGAVNIPLFSDDERAEIGTLYKALGRDRAVGRGRGLVEGRLAEFAAAFDPFRGREILVYCARGGMRSASVVELLAGLEHKVTQLPGGYKAYRNHLLHKFQHSLPPRLIVIHGQTGVGKTLLLQRLENRLDLEDAASHRSSVFGAINLNPRTQQNFEAELGRLLDGLDHGRPVWVEGESRKIGGVFMPDALRRQMQISDCVLVTAPLETRVERIVAEYGQTPQKALEQWEQALAQLTRVLGRERTSSMLARIAAGDLHSVAAELLVDYYDPRYAHSMKNNRYGLTVSAEDLDAAAAELEKFARNLDKSPAPGPSRGAL